MTFLRRRRVEPTFVSNSKCRQALCAIIFALLIGQSTFAQQSTQQIISALIRQNHLQDAEQQLWVVLEAHPEAGWPLSFLGRIRLRQSRFDEAEALFRKVLQTNPKDTQAYRGLAETYRLEGKDD